MNILDVVHNLAAPDPTIPISKADSLKALLVPLMYCGIAAGILMFLWGLLSKKGRWVLGGVFVGAVLAAPYFATHGLTHK